MTDEKYLFPAGSEELYAALREEDFRYHSFSFNDGTHIEGDYDIAKNIHEYPFPKSLKGLKVLDVGCGGGWYSVYFALQGAEVTAFDARGLCDMDVVGRTKYPPVEDEKKEPDRYIDGLPVYNNRTSNTLFHLIEEYNLDIKFVGGRIYYLDTLLEEEYDLVFFGNVLLHLRDPIRALAAIRNVCKGRLVVTALVNNKDVSIPRLLYPYSAFSNRAFCIPNTPAIEFWCKAANFKTVDVSQTLLMHADLSRPHIGDAKYKANETMPNCVAMCEV